MKINARKLISVSVLLENCLKPYPAHSSKQRTDTNPANGGVEEDRVRRKQLRGLVTNDPLRDAM